MDVLPDLGELENEVMQVVWSHQPTTAEEVRGQLNRGVRESTVRTVLRRLEGKGYATHTVEGRTHLYRATHSRAWVAARAVEHFINWFCNGSIDEVLVGMVDTAMLDIRKLRMLADRIERAKGKK
jgi:predicted transcriptional regulator